MKHLIYIFFISFFLFSCNNKKTKKTALPEQGVISYAIEYPNEISQAPTASLMPQTMKFSFKKQKIAYYLKGSFNIFSLNFISHSPTDSCTTIFRFIDRNLESSTPPDKRIFLFNTKETPKIIYLNNHTKVIAGFNCRKALVTFKETEPFYVYYTNEINLINPNRNSILGDIKGVLMEFFIDFNGVRFHFTAENFDSSNPPRSEFKIPRKTEPSTQEEIEALIITLINNFQ
ncbi:hypothetical protein E9993_17540 [Labilibacter sediminis]|nr:hypothetical protein E9993_17540 [Labilibacter sediminis]